MRRKELPQGDSKLVHQTMASKTGSGFFGNGGENRQELVGFVLEAGKPGGRYDVGERKKVQPVGSFVEFLEAVSYF